MKAKEIAPRHILTAILAAMLVLVGCSEQETVVQPTEEVGSGMMYVQQIPTEQPVQEPAEEPPQLQTEEPTQTAEPAEQAKPNKHEETKPRPTEPAETAPPETRPKSTEPLVTVPPVTEPKPTEPPVTKPPAMEPPETEPPATEPPAAEPAGEELDLDALESYGRSYASSTYGYKGSSGTGFSSGAGYYPPSRLKITSMEEGKRRVRELVDSQYRYDVAAGQPITAEIDGQTVRRKINVYIKPTDDPDVYLLYCFYGGK